MKNNAINQNEEFVSDSTKDSSKEKNKYETEFDIIEWIDEVAACDEPLDKKMVFEQREHDMLDQISESIAQQICQEMDATISKEPEKSKKYLPRWFRIAGITVGMVTIISLLLLFTPLGNDILIDIATNYAYGKMVYDDGSTLTLQEVIYNAKENAIQMKNGELTKLNEELEKKNAREEESIVNILLLGEEAIGSGDGRGRTDVMIIATLNTEDKTVKLTSLMRDMLVQIPGYADNKLNAAYQLGGVPLLYDTLEQNFDIKLNGYAKVDFDDFEDVINKLGGVKISLTAAEANYLNSTNYISKPEYRNVVEGPQVLNGNQALGYCRIRYVKTGDNQADDYGRTSRQRVVLNAIFEQYKSKSLPELLFLADDILGLVKSDITIDDFEQYLKAALTMGLSDIENLRIPADNTFESGYSRKMSVLIPDYSANTEILHNFIFGDTKE